MGRVHGRKKDDGRVNVLHELCNWLEEEMQHSLLTLDQLHQKLLTMTPDKSLAYSKRYLKNNLGENYNKRLCFTSKERRSDVLCFKDLTADIMRQHHENIEVDKKTTIIKSAVGRV